MKNGLFKKSMSVFLAVLMLLSSWVFVPGEHHLHAEAKTDTIGLSALASISNGQDRANGTRITICSDGLDRNTTVGVAKFNIGALPATVTNATLNLNISSADDIATANFYLVNPDKCGDVTSIGQDLSGVSTILGNKYTGYEGANNAYNYYEVSGNAPLGTVSQTETGIRSFNVTGAVNTAKANGWNDLCLVFIMPRAFSNNGDSGWSDIYINVSNTNLVCEYAGVYGMPEVGLGNKLDGSITTNVSNRIITVKYPTKMYIDISEDLSDAGYSINVSCNTNNRMIVYPAVWGGQESDTNGNFENDRSNYDANLDGQNTIINAFDKYGIQKTGPGKFDNETIGGEYTTCLVHNNASTELSNGANYALQGKPKAVGEYRYYLVGNSGINPRLTYLQTGGTTNKNDSGYITGNVDFTIYVYNKATLNSTVNTLTLADSESVKYTDASWNDYKAALNNAKSILSTREVTQNQIDEAYRNLTAEHGDLELKTFTVTFNTLGGNTISPKTYKYGEALGQSFTVPTKAGYTFDGWYADKDGDGQRDDNEWVTNADGSFVDALSTYRMDQDWTIYPHWIANNYNVTFDNLIDFSKWDTTNVSHGTITEKTDNGFTLAYNNDGADEGTTTSPYFPVEEGKQYRVDADIIGDAWDIYIFFYDDNTQSGLGIEFSDGPGRRYSSGSDWEPVFTAPSGATRAVIRLDANGSNNVVRFETIRIYEDGKVADGLTSYHNGKEVTYGSAYGTLPSPTREGYTFAGWVDENGTSVDESALVNIAKNHTLYSTWTANTYTVTWKYADNTTKTETYSYGAIPTAPENTKAYNDTAGHHTFAWDSAIGAVTGDVTYTEKETKVDHTVVTDAAVAATCTAPGKTEGSHCSVCNFVIVAQTEIPAKGHTWGNWTETKAPACTVDGEEKRTCSTCSVSETRVKTAPGHTPGAEATCTSPQTCTVCGAELVAEKGHIPGAEATCTAPQTCTVCGVEINPAKGHSYTYTSTNDGKHTIGCKNCSYTETANCADTNYNCHCDKCNYVDASFHNPGAEATCITAQTCTVCSTVITAATGVHVYGAWSQYNNGEKHRRTCTLDENCTAYEEGSHEFNGAARPAEGRNGYHEYKCSLCEAYGAKINGEYKLNGVEACYSATVSYEIISGDIEKHTVICVCGNKKTAAHDTEVLRVIEEPTCTETGSQDEKCKLCNYTFTREIPANGHTFTETAAKPATCTADGNEAYRQCKTCSLYFAENAEKYATNGAQTNASFIINKLGHTFTKTAAKPATCTEDGNEAYKYCETCKLYFAENAEKYAANGAQDDSAYIIESKGHTPAEAVKENIVQATCDADGSYNEVVYCSVETCKAKISTTPKTILARGHNMGDWYYASEDDKPTYNKTGTQTKACKNTTESEDKLYAACNHTETQPVPMLDDSIAPTGKIGYGTSTWDKFLENITFGIYVSNSVELEITADDAQSGVAKIEYYISDKALTEADVKALADTAWTAYTEKVTIKKNEAEKLVAYAKITDNQGNVTYLSTNGAVFDNTAPVITSDIECTSATITITEANIQSVTVNGAAVELDADGKYTVEGEGEYKVVVTDKVGKITEAIVTVKGHNFAEPTYGWDKSEDGKWICAAKRVCKNNGCAEEETATATVTSEVTTDPTCEGKGKTTYTAKFAEAWAEVQTQTKEDVAALGHSYGEATYSFAADGSACTATRVCGNDASHVETATAKITSNVTTPATCTEKGTTTYTATFEGVAWAEAQTKVVVDIPALNHNYGEATYNFAADGSACTATRVCGNDASHVETATATVSSKVTTDPTCEGMGTTTYTATFAETWAVSKTKEVQDVPAINHNYGEATYNFAADGSACTATRVCKNDASHVETAEATITSVEKTAATCTEKGTTTYTAEFDVDWAETKTLDVQDIPAINHNYGEATYNFAADGSACTATRVCKNDASHVETAEAKITSAVKTPATCTEMGTTTYTATFEGVDWTETQTKAVVDIPAINHNYGEATYSFAENGSACTATRVCGNDASHVETANATITSAEKIAATCTVDGWTTYTAKFDVDWAKEQTLDVQDIPAINHNYGEATYNFAADGSACTATRVCKNDASHVETAEATITSVEKTAATCTEKGTTTYTAKFDVDWAETKTLDVVDIAAKNHAWADATYSFAADGKSCTATRVCGNDASHVETAEATITSVEKTAATCTEKGTTTYTAKFDVDWAKTKTLDVVDIAAKNHAWADATYSFAADGKSCTATRVCGNDASHVETATATVSSKVTTDPTCEGMGTTTYTATFAETWAVSKTKEVQDIPAINHNWKSEVTKEPGCETEGVMTYTCQNDNSHKYTEKINPLNHIDVDPADGICDRCDAEICTHTNTKETARVEATCTTAGNIEYWTCALCKKNFSDADCKNIVATVVIPAKGHNYGEWIEEVPATCISTGTKGHYDCSACDKYFDAQKAEISDLIIAIVATAHTKLVKTEANATTCEDAGNIAYWTCEGCKKIYSDAEAKTEITAAQTVVPAKGHNYGEWIEEVPATCISTGTKGHYDCSACDKYFDAEKAEISDLTIAIVATAHTKLVKTEANAATCEDAGNIAYWTCEGCKKIYSDAEAKTEITAAQTVVPAKGHNYGEWIEEVPATCISTGTKGHYDCSACDKYFDAQKAELSDLTIAIVATAHTKLVKTEVNAATCEDAGNIAYWTCEGCKKIYSDAEAKTEITAAQTVVPAKGHNYGEWIEEVPATCISTGTKGHYDCSACDKYFDADKAELADLTIAINPTAHTYTSVVTAPTCDLPGYTTHTCSGCGDTKVDTNVDALGHKYEVTDHKDASCTAEGYDVYTCKNDTTHTYTEVLDKLAHTEEILPGKAATCKDDGLTEGKKCSVCGTVTVSQQTIPATGEHKEISIGDVPATCVSTGSKGKVVCEICGTTISEDEVIPKTDHQYGAAPVHVIPATCIKGKVSVYKCKFCDERKEVEDPANEKAPHTIVEVCVVEATCEFSGVYSYYCTTCSETVKSETIPALGHADKNGDELCDNCNGKYVDPDNNKVCGCICHKEGAFMKFIYKIVRFFWKLFKISKSCSCGAVHY